MKTMIAVLGVVISTQSLAAGDVMMQVDQFLAQDSYAEAFKCGDEAETESNHSYDPSDISLTHYLVAECGSLTQIDIIDVEGVETQYLDKDYYDSVAGNPLRMFQAEKLVQGFMEDEFNWVSATPVHIDYLGAKRKALKVLGEGEACVIAEEGEKKVKTEECYPFSTQITIVQDVPFLARLATIELDIPDFALKFENKVTNFNRNK